MPRPNALYSAPKKPVASIDPLKMQNPNKAVNEAEGLIRCLETRQIRTKVINFLLDSIAHEKSDKFNLNNEKTDYKGQWLHANGETLSKLTSKLRTHKELLEQLPYFASGSVNQDQLAIFSRVRAEKRLRHAIVMMVVAVENDVTPKQMLEIFNIPGLNTTTEDWVANVTESGRRAVLEPLFVKLVQLVVSTMTSETFANFSLQELRDKKFRFEKVWIPLCSRNNMIFLFNHCSHVLDIGAIFNNQKEFDIGEAPPDAKNLMMKRMLMKGMQGCEIVFHQIDRIIIEKSSVEDLLPVEFSEFTLHYKHGKLVGYWAKIERSIDIQYFPCKSFSLNKTINRTPGHAVEVHDFDIDNWGEVEENTE